MGRVLNQTVLAGGVVYPAGTAETKELAEKITNPAHWTGEASSESTDTGYDGLKVDELKATIAARNEGRDEAKQIPATGNKADLVAALEADDAANAG